LTRIGQFKEKENEKDYVKERINVEGLFDIYSDRDKVDHYYKTQEGGGGVFFFGTI
jgi:hypothetical protein